MRFIFVFCLMLFGGCGYHLVGQGESNVIPEGVVSATLLSTSGKAHQPLLLELKHLWLGNTFLPSLQDERFAKDHVTLRIEQVKESFVPIGFDAEGLAIQYRLTISAMLNMYQVHTLIWKSGVVSVSASVLVGSDPSVVEAEKAKLTEQLQRKWAQDALARLQSGF